MRAAIDAGKTIVGLEPSCTLMMRDEAVNLIPDWTEEMGAPVLTFAESIVRNPPHPNVLHLPDDYPGSCGLVG